MLLDRKLNRQYKQNEGKIKNLKKYNPKQFYSKFGEKDKNKKSLFTLDRLLYGRLDSLVVYAPV